MIRPAFSLICVLMLLLLSPHAASAQTPSPWTGVIRDDAEQAAGAFAGYSVIRQRGMSADGRFLVFDSDRTLVAGDTNGALDVFVRDRQTGTLTRVSVATNGTQGNSHSTSPAISANGRHVVFQSLASNLDPTDTNAVQDLYVRDLETHATTLVSVGPSGERLTCNCEPGRPVARLSGDGRFVLFSADFGSAAGTRLWLRDRDADQDGVLDEPGGVNTTGIQMDAIEGDLLGWIDSVAISNDARYVAFTASAYDENGIPLGLRLYLHDRTLGTSTRVDRPLPSSGDVNALSVAPDFSDNGQLAYTSTAPNLVPGDTDQFADVFVYDIATATNTRLQLTPANTAFVYADGVAISADGRFVSFMGYEIDGGGTERWNVYAFDREISASFVVSIRTDGSRDDNATGSSMSADGSAIAFNGGTEILQQGILVGGVFVATAVSLTSTVTQVPMSGGSVPVEIAVPADTFWTALLVEGERNNYALVSTYSGVGPDTIAIDIPNSPDGEPHTYQLWLGSKAVVVQQLEMPEVYWLDPYSGSPTTGGTPFQIYGSGFQAGATVTFDDVPATDVVVEEGGAVLHGVTPPHAAGVARVTVTNPNGASNPEPGYFFYQDETPNQPPTANAGGPYSGVRNAAISFSGATSSDPDGDALTYSWNFGDGSTGTGAAPAHAYASAGTFTVTLTVNDGTANSTPATAAVTVANQAPTAHPGGPQTGTRLADIGFNGAASTDPEGDALTYAWTFGDGSMGSGVSPAHRYAALGTFTVTLTVNDGTTSSAPVSTTVQIGNVGPAVALTSPAAGAVFIVPSGIPVSAAASDPDGAVSLVEFYAGAAKIGQATSAPYAMTWTGAAAGTYALTAKVIDDSGAAVMSAPVSVTVNAPPSVVLTSPAANAQFAAPATISLAASASDSDGLVTQVEFFQGATSLGVDTTSPYTATWSGVAPGSYAITAVARDNLGAVVTTTGITVKVTVSVAPTADAFVRSSTPNANLGNNNSLITHWGTTSSNQRWAYVKFDLTSVPSISDAKLQVFGAISGTTSNVIQTAVYPVADTSWAETGITWNNKPSPGATALSVVTIVTSSKTPRWYELDVTAYLQAEKAAGRNVVTLVLKNIVQSTQEVDLNSKEATNNRPALFVVP